MEKIQMEHYFTNMENNSHYYNPKIMITILEDIFKRNIFDIERKIDSCYIHVNEDDIKDFLEQKLIEEDFELKQRIEAPKKKRSSNLAYWTKEDVENSSQEFIDELSMQRYTFEPYTLEYFIRYTSIVRNKINELISIIKNLSTKKIDVIEEELKRLDINLDENNDIHKSDIIRLIIPAMYNIKLLNDKVNEANNLETYLTFKMSRHSLYKEGFMENEIYPNQEIIIKSLEYDGCPGYVPLTDNQKQQLWDKRDKSIKIIAKILID